MTVLFLTFSRWNQMWWISILSDFRPMAWRISFHAVIVFGLGKDLFLKSVLGHCGVHDSIVKKL